MTGSRFLYRGRFLGIRECENWEFASRTNARAVAVLVPVTDEQELVLVEQFRIPVQSPVIELPAGLVGDQDDADESVLTAAARELEEETGFTAGRLTPLMTCPSSAGLSDEMITFVLAEDLARTGPGGGDASEDIQVHRVPLASASDWLSGQMGRGKQVDPKIYAVLYWLGRRAAGLPLPP
jgi:ADP-ribose pyrophosphatase